MKKGLLIVAILLLSSVSLFSQEWPDLTEDLWKEMTVEQLKEYHYSGKDIDAKGGKEQTPLMYASGNSSIEIIQYLLNSGADVNAKDINENTPLMYASGWNSLENVKLLLRNKADIDARNIDGVTPLMYASGWSSLEIVKLLLRNKANINAKSLNGWIPLNFAVRFSSHPEIIEFLIDISGDQQNWETLWEFLNYNEDLKGTEVYWKINDYR